MSIVTLCKQDEALSFALDMVSRGLSYVDYAGYTYQYNKPYVLRDEYYLIGRLLDIEIELNNQPGEIPTNLFSEID